MTAIWAVVKQQLRIIRRDPWFLCIMFAMPLVVMPLFKSTMGLSLQASGYAGASGAADPDPAPALPDPEPDPTATTASGACGRVGFF